MKRRLICGVLIMIVIMSFGMGCSNDEKDNGSGENKTNKEQKFKNNDEEQKYIEEAKKNLQKDKEGGKEEDIKEGDNVEKKD